MNLKIDKETLLILYRRHRDYIIPIATIIICFILLLNVTIPLLRDLSLREQQLKVEKDKLNVFKKNLSVLNSVSTEALDKEVSLTTSALPVDKNFAAILNSVTIAANKSGIFLGDYGFTVGDLSNTTVIGKTLPSFQLSLSVSGGVNGAINFVDQLYKTLPLSEVSNMQIGSRSIIHVSFYYKPYPGGASVGSLLPEISKKNMDNLSQISIWNNGNTLESILPNINIATGSAVASPSASPSAPF